MEAAGDDHRTPGQEHRPVARTAPQHQAVPARRSFTRKQRLAHARMNAVGADQNIAAHGFRMGSRAIEEMRGDAPPALAERPEPAAGVEGLRPEPLLDGAMDHALQPAAMDRELGHVMTGGDASGFLPDFLAMAIEIIEIVGADRDVVEFLQKAEAGKFADRMGQRVDADTEFTDRIGLLEQFATDAAGTQHQRRSQASDTTPDDNRLHRLNSTHSIKHDGPQGRIRPPRPQAALSPRPSARHASWA